MTRSVLAILAAVLTALAQGPDEGGYRYLDSDAPGGPGFRWVDITGIGTRIPLEDDDNLGPFATGLPCDFYGSSYVTAPDGQWQVPTGPTANLVSGWAFIAEFVAACLRHGKMPAMYQGYAVPGAKERSAALGG